MTQEQADNWHWEDDFVRTAPQSLLDKLMDGVITTQSEVWTEQGVF